MVEVSINGSYGKVARGRSGLRQQNHAVIASGLKFTRLKNGKIKPTAVQIVDSSGIRAGVAQNRGGDGSMWISWEKFAAITGGYTTATAMWEA